MTDGKQRRFVGAVVSLAAAALIAAALTGCAATRTPPDDSDRRLQAASQHFGGRYEYLIVHSAGELRDSLFAGVNRITGPSEMARDLATRFTAAEKGSLRILVTGPDAQKTLDVIRDAFHFHRKNRLPGLELLFLGEPAHEAQVRALAEGVGGTMRFAAFDG